MKKSIFEHFFLCSESKYSVFEDLWPRSKFTKKSRKSYKSARGGRISWGNHPKPIFWSLGGPCGQNESYTSLKRPFSKKLCFGEVRAFLADFPEIAFWSMCGYVISREKNLHFKGNNFFAEVSSGKCLLGRFAWENLVFVSKTWFKTFLHHFEIGDLAYFDDFC